MNIFLLFFDPNFVQNPFYTIFRKISHQKTINYMLLEIFSAPIDSGAQLFLLIVCILAGLGAGISAVDFRSTKAPKEVKRK
jgi:hypothetical protein